ncbi:glycosyl transferase [Altererythrobacter aurantiacus]|uniref:Glycosyl transferase n=1 Tax=Parapontixanthobacter aurantiacus TaxID=1463599 RepID=A0A844ZDD1_9SPHN|nr:galactosyltransferase-related protein [Parapontixanthobacter aurantiacus]MXO86551.1 glycosyl transferase [Parapontixanthobacter aurantiacus]
MKISVCTLGHGRADHLRNLVRGLQAQTEQPHELVIGVMQDERYDVPQTEFPVRQILLEGSDMPLAAARNAAGSQASGELLIFLDIDCIPSPSLVADYRRGASTAGGLLMGEVGYLPKGIAGSCLDFDLFERVAVRHSERPGPPAGPIGACSDYRCFWSLNFALPKAVFTSLGGFDERYRGYGGEDTDFGRMLWEAGTDLWWVRGAKAFHQYHPHHMPPVHHLDSILANTKVFQEKWGEPTMQHWLRAFRLMGLIDRDGDDWIKLRDPTPAHLQLTRQQEHEPYASSSAVLETLEREADAFASAERSTRLPEKTEA